MAFENLTKPPHLRRFLLALAAGSAALVIYFTAEHFKVVPGTSALDHEAPPVPALGERSIAVIPRESEPTIGTAHAIALELYRRLARHPEMQVIAPRSAFAYAAEGRGRSVRGLAPDIAWQLDIEVRPRGSLVAFRASMRAAGERQPAWTREDEGPAADLGGFVDAVDAALAAQFGFEPSASAEPSGAPAPSIGNDYVVAWTLARLNLVESGVARTLFDEVLTRAPGWAPAHTGLAYTLLQEAAVDTANQDALLAAAREHLDAAAAADPAWPETDFCRSLLSQRFEWDWQGAYRAAQSALELAPGDAEYLLAASTAAFTVGEFARGEAWLRQAVALDPLALGHRLKLGLMLEFSGRTQDAIDAYRALMVIEPDFPAVHAYLSRTLSIVGRSQAALRHAGIEAEPFWRQYATILALYALDRREEADGQLEIFIADYVGQAAIQVAELHAFAGRGEEAFEWLDRAVEARDPGVASLVGNPLFSGLRDEPRWDSLLDRLGLGQR